MDYSRHIIISKRVKIVINLLCQKTRVIQILSLLYSPRIPYLHAQLKSICGRNDAYINVIHAVPNTQHIDWIWISLSTMIRALLNDNPLNWSKWIIWTSVLFTPLSIQGRRYQFLSIENNFDVIEKRASIFQKYQKINDLAQNSLKWKVIEFNL